MAERIVAVNLDANESAFFARELEFVKARTYDKRYPEYKAQALIPVSTEAGAGAESITYRQFDSVGLMKLIANYADDLPRADVYGAEFTSPVRSLGGSYGWNLQEIRNGQMSGRPLSTRKAEAARLAYEQTVNRLAWYARAADGKSSGLNGFLHNANITKKTAPNNAGDTSRKWVDKTADEILLDLNNGVNDIIELTKGVEIPDTVLLPIKQYTHIATTPRSATSDTTILEFFLRNNPNITSVEWVNELKDVSPKPSDPTGSGTCDCMIVYKRDPIKLTLELPQMFEQLPVQERGLEYIVPTHARIGGVIVYYPLSIAIVEEI